MEIKKYRERMVKVNIGRTGNVGASLFVLTVSGSLLSPAWAQGPGDELNVINSGEFVDGQLVNVTRTPLPVDATSDAPPSAPKPGAPAASGPPNKVHPKLEEAVRTRPGHELVKVIVMFSEDTEIPKMPFLDGLQPRDSEENRARLAVIQSHVDAIKAQRAPRYQEKARALHRDFGARIEEEFWLVNGVVAEVPVSAIHGISQRPDVLYVQPNERDIKPLGYYVSDGRSRINSDPYFNANLTSGYIGVVDSGIRTTHSLLSSPSRIGVALDCTSGSCSASATATTDSCNHGTAEAAILTGNSNIGPLYRGVTGITVDSFKVFDESCMAFAADVTVAIQGAVLRGDRVISLALATPENELGIVATAADNAFNANRIVIAGAGNNGPNSGTVTSPGLAHKVIAVGAENVNSALLESYSGRGPTADWRTKPDIIAPTSTKTASNTGDTATWYFTGTSGATPYVSGAAMLISNFYQRYMTVDAGHVYAALIAFGNNSSTTVQYDNNRGAGRLVLATGGYLDWGTTTSTTGKNVDIPVVVQANRKSIDVAIWWPETAVQTHNDLDLRLINPSGQIVGSSLGGGGVFEKVHFDTTTSLATGTWKVRISGYSVTGPSPQWVYWAFHHK